MRLFGERARFALGFQLIPDPDQGSPPLRRVSWGKLQIWVSRRNLTAGISDDHAVVDCAEVPLAPIVAWMVANWDPMLHETRLPLPAKSAGSAAWCLDCLISLPDDDFELDKLLDARAEWRNRHSMGSSLPDFRVPDLHLRRVNSGIELSWDDREWRNVPNSKPRAQPFSQRLRWPRSSLTGLCRWPTNCNHFLNQLSLLRRCSAFFRATAQLLQR